MSSETPIKLPEITRASTMQPALDCIKSTFIFPDFSIVDQGIGEYFIGSKRIIERSYVIELEPSKTYIYEISLTGDVDLFTDFLNSLYAVINDLLLSYFSQFQQAARRGIICPNFTSHSITKKLEVSCTWDKTGNEIVSGAIYLTLEEK